MIHSIINKWSIGATVLLLIVAAACYIWYQVNIAPTERQAAETEKLVQQWETERVQKPIAADKTSTKALVETTNETAEKPINNNTFEVENNTQAAKQQKFDTPAETAVAVDVLVSPHGFGPYPMVSDDYPLTTEWERFPDNPDKTHELLSRVLVKLWTEGKTNFSGGSIENGKVYPHFNDTVYVTWREYEDTNGKMVRRVGTITSGTRVKFTRADLYNPPPGLRVLDFETAGIDPYQYLNLPKK